MPTKPTTINSFKGEYFFLSNFYLHSVDYGGATYPSTEHAFQAAKSTDFDIRERIRLAPTPGAAKKLGKPPAKGGIVVLRAEWDKIRVGVMRRIVQRKFEDRHLSQLLLATDDAELVEGNWWNDRFWGVCRGEGENQLGRILMEIRDQLRSD